MQTIRQTSVIMALIFCICANAFAAEPVEIVKGHTGDIHTIEKVYILNKDENAEIISKDGFIENGIAYSFYEMKTRDNSKEESKEHTETVHIAVSSTNTQEAIAKFEETVEISTEDGFIGILKPDFATLNIAASGYGKQSYTITENRNYPNLSDADTSLVPKTITQNGVTLNLSNIEWQSAKNDSIDGQEYAVRYTALATYSGTGSKTYAKGYTASVTYKGEIKKVIDDTITYTAVFHEVPTEKSWISYWWIYILALLALGGVGYGSYRLIRKRKKGY